MRKIVILCLLTLLALSSCYRQPELHLYDWENERVFDLPLVEISLDTYWDYDMMGTYHNWRDEWYYGWDKETEQLLWDEEDRDIFGEFDYVEPTHFFLRRYYTGNVPYGTRIKKKEAYIEGRTFRAPYDWGFWDILVWNDVKTLDDVQSLVFDEKSSYDEDIIAYTRPTMYTSRYHAPRYQNSFYEPEQLFSVCEKGIEIDKDLTGFVYEEENNMWVKKLKMYLEPITYIYLPQIILHHNINSITGVRRILTKNENGGSQTFSANISGMARTTCLNTGVAGTDAIAVNYKMRAKEDMNKDGEAVDIIGGRFMTFGLCGKNANRISRADDFDKEHHYIDVQLQFYNGTDSTLVFDVTDQVRERYKGGVITIELDMDTVPIPKRATSGFNAIVEEEDSVIHVINL